MKKLYIDLLKNNGKVSECREISLNVFYVVWQFDYTTHERVIVHRDTADIYLGPE